MTIAGQVIEKLGGVAKVSEITGINVSQIHRWRWAKKRGGTDGRIPTQHQQVLLDYARKHHLPLTPDDFFDPSPSAAKPKLAREARA